jgi:hypothetical protein
LNVGKSIQLDVSASLLQTTSYIIKPYVKSFLITSWLFDLFLTLINCILFSTSPYHICSIFSKVWLFSILFLLILVKFPKFTDSYICTIFLVTLYKQRLHINTYICHIIMITSTSTIFTSSLFRCLFIRSKKSLLLFTDQIIIILS